MMEIKVPELAESITEGTISKWVVREGEAVREGDVVAELETDKVNVEISAEQSGVLKKILKGEGETVRVGEAIALLGEADGEAAESEAGKKRRSRFPIRLRNPGRRKAVKLKRMPGHLPPATPWPRPPRESGRGSGESICAGYPSGIPGEG